MKINILFELYCDNIPARMQHAAKRQLYEKIAQQFVDFEISELYTFVTTFRFGFHLQCVQKTEKKIKGPKCNASQQAIDGFARKHNISTNALLIDAEKEVKTFYIVQSAEEILTNNVIQILQSFSWPITMRWDDSNQYWVRPIHNIFCICNGEILLIEFAGFKSTNCTFDCYEEPIQIQDFDDYLQKMQENKIFIDKKEHENDIVEQVKKIAPDLQIAADFLEEITGLSEYTYCFATHFSLENFHELPIFAVKKLFLQQKCIFLPEQNQVIIFSNTATENAGENINNGYKIMLESKLEDLLFFYHKDCAKSENDFIEQLDHLIFHKKLGNMKKKAIQVAKITQHIIDNDFPELAKTKTKHDLEKIVLLCKADLTSSMVNEMPEIRGFIGAHYWKRLSIADQICTIIASHYEFFEKNFSDQNTQNLSLIINFADHLHTILSFLTIGEIPTGSKDPWGLKNHLDHIIIYGTKLKIDISPYIESTFNLLRENLQFDTEKTQRIFHELIFERFIFNYFANEEKSWILAILYNHINFNFAKIHENISQILQYKSQISDLLPTYKRIKNLLKNKDKKSQNKFNLIHENYFAKLIEENFDQIDQKKLNNTAEKNLFSFLNQDLMQKNRIDLLQKLHANQNIIHDFFDNCLINSEDQIEKQNRHTLVQILQHYFISILNFDLL